MSIGEGRPYRDVRYEHAVQLASGRTSQAPLTHGSFRDWPDILMSGSPDPASPCDGISVGIGFEARAVRLDGVLPEQPPPVGCNGWTL